MNKWAVVAWNEADRSDAVLLRLPGTNQVAIFTLCTEAIAFARLEGDQAKYFQPIMLWPWR